MGRILKYTAIGCGGLIGLVVFLVIVGAIVGGGGGGGNSASSGSGGSGGSGGSKDSGVGAKELADQGSSKDGGGGGGGEARPKPKPDPAKKAAGGGGDSGGSDDEVLIRISGAAGNKFSGSYGNVDTQRSVDGTVPHTYHQKIDSGAFSADIVSVTFQKVGGGSWPLEVELVYQGEVVKQAQTSAQYGVVSANWSTTE